MTLEFTSLRTSFTNVSVSITFIEPFIRFTFSNATQCIEHIQEKCCSELFCASYNIEMTRGYGVKTFHRFLNLAVSNFYLAVYLEERHASIGFKWVSI